MKRQRNAGEPADGSVYPRIPLRSIQASNREGYSWDSRLETIEKLSRRDNFDLLVALE